MDESSKVFPSCAGMTAACRMLGAARVWAGARLFAIAKVWADARPCAGTLGCQVICDPAVCAAGASALEGEGTEDAAAGGISTQHPGCCSGAAVAVKLVATALGTFQGKDGPGMGSARLAMPGSICWLMGMPESIW